MSSAAFCLRWAEDESLLSQLFLYPTSEPNPRRPVAGKSTGRKPKEHESRTVGFQKKAHILRMTRAKPDVDTVFPHLFHNQQTGRK